MFQRITVVMVTQLSEYTKKTLYTLNRILWYVNYISMFEKAVMLGTILSRDSFIEMMKTELRTKRKEKFTHIAICRETTNNVPGRRKS